MITIDDVSKAISAFSGRQAELADHLRRGDEVIQEQPLFNIQSVVFNDKQTALNMQRGSKQNHTNVLMEEIENGIVIVEHALNRVRLLLRARPEIYKDAEADTAAKDIISHQNIAQGFLTQISDLSAEDISSLTGAQPNGERRLPRIQRRAAAARYDFEMVTDYIESSAQEGKTRTEQQKAEYFDYAPKIPANPREAYIDGCLDLAKLFTNAVYHKTRRMESLLDLLDLNRMAFIPLKLIDEEEGLKLRVNMLREYKTARDDVLNMVDITKGYFLQAMHFTAQEP